MKQVKGEYRNAMKERTGRAMGIMLLLTGSAHFLFPKSLDAIVPNFLPGDARLWTNISGVAEFAVAVGLLAPIDMKVGGIRVRLIAAQSAFLLFLAVYPANIKMAIDWSDRTMPAPLIAFARLPLQFGLFYWAASIAKSVKKIKP